MERETTSRTVASSSNDVALYIDWESLKYGLSGAGKAPNILALIEIAERFGRLVVARAYADWEDPFYLDSQDLMHLYDRGIDPIYVPNRPSTDPSRQRKSLLEERLTSDCLEISYTRSPIRAYVIVSGDRNFFSLCRSLRSRGNRVVRLGLSWQISPQVRDRVDDLLFYDREIDGRSGRYSPALREPSAGDRDAAIQGLVSLVKEQREEGRYPLLSWLGHQMRRQVPDFAPQAYGFEKFKDFVKDAEQQGVIKIVTQGLVDWAVLPEDEIPNTALEEAARFASTGQTSGLLESGGEATPYPFAVGTHPILDSDDPLGEYREVFVDIARTAQEIENDDRYDFMTPGFLGQCLWRKGHWDPATLPPGTVPAGDLLKDLRAGQIRKLVDYAVDEGLLHSTMRYDPNTGKTFPIIRLNRSHPFIRESLGEDSSDRP